MRGEDAGRGSLVLLGLLLAALLLLGVFIPVVQATTGTANQVRSRVVVDVYVKDGATDAQKAQLRQRLIATPNVKSVQYIPKAAALQTMRPGAKFSTISQARRATGELRHQPVAAAEQPSESAEETSAS